MLFCWRRRQRFLSTIIRSWHEESTLRSKVDNSRDSSDSAFKDSSALGKMLFKKVVDALGEEVKTTLRLG
jgi:hypothetical protein